MQVHIKEDNPLISALGHHVGTEKAENHVLARTVNRFKILNEAENAFPFKHELCIFMKEKKKGKKLETLNERFLTMQTSAVTKGN